MSSPLHRLAPQVKLVAAFGFVVVVLSVPRGQLLPYLAPLVALHDELARRSACRRYP